MGPSTMASPSSVSDAANRRPAVYAFCHPFSAQALQAAAKLLRDPAFRSVDATSSEAQVLEDLRKRGGGLIRLGRWREIWLRYDDATATPGPLPKPYHYRNGYLYIDRAIDAIAVTDLFEGGVFAPRLAYVHVLVPHGDGRGPSWIAVSSLSMAPICTVRAPGTSNPTPATSSTNLVSPTPPPCTTPHMDAMLTRTVQPKYPESAREQGATGTVQVKVSLNPSGGVISTSIYKSSGNAELDQAALVAARESTYSPEIEDCQPVGGTYLFRASFYKSKI